MTTASDNKKIPNKVFIVPYRNREEQKFFFCKYMSYIMEDFTDYEIYFSHQTDNRSFNRGATKNIGFLAIKDKYPDNYKNITFIFNDVDTIPFTKIFNYETSVGVVKHYYGFKYTLGGIVVIKGADFEEINGYPNYWGWGSEDSCLQKRCEKANLVIDRSNFFPIGSPQILHLFDGISRIINKKDSIREKNDNGIDGISSIYQLQYTIDETSTNTKDNLYNVDNPRINFINIAYFLTAFDYNNDSKEFYNYDLREPKKKIIEPNLNRKCDVNNMNQSTESWTNIPYYPTINEKKEMISLGIKPPNPYDNTGYNYNLNDRPPPQYYQTKNILQQQQQQQKPQQQIFQRNIFQPHNFKNKQFMQYINRVNDFNYSHKNKIYNQEQIIKQDNISLEKHEHSEHYDNSEITQENTQTKMPDVYTHYTHPQINIYSPNYASYMGIKPKATTSAKLNMTTLMKSMRTR